MRTALSAALLILVLGCSAGGDGAKPGSADAGGSAGDASGGSQSGGSEIGGSAGSPSGGATTGGVGTGGTSGSPSGGTSTGGTPPQPVNGLGPFAGNDDVAPSQSPPFGLRPDQVPQFVTIGFDDNSYPDGMQWATGAFATRTNPAGSGNPGTYDGTVTHATFYLTTVYVGTWMAASPTLVKAAWHTAVVNGDETGSHTHNHQSGAAYDAATWQTEIQTSIDWMVKPFDPAEVSYQPSDTAGPGVDRANIKGFRTPFLEYSNALFSTLRSSGFWYDCSIEDGWQEDQDGSNYLWPYTLDDGSPGHDLLVSWGLKQALTGGVPGLWEMPVHPVIVPPDDRCAEYGVPSGLRAKIKAAVSYFDDVGGKITGLDYNMWVSMHLTAPEFLATLKYTLDQRLAGNRAPMMWGAHSDEYSATWGASVNATLDERRAVVEAFLDYALSKPDVRIVSVAQILDWVRNPTALR